MIEKLEKMLELAELKADFEKRIVNRNYDIWALSGYFPELIAKLEFKIRLYKIYIEFIDEKLNRLKLEL